MGRKVPLVFVPLPRGVTGGGISPLEDEVLGVGKVLGETAPLPVPLPLPAPLPLPLPLPVVGTCPPGGTGDGLLGGKLILFFQFQSQGQNGVIF